MIKPIRPLHQRHIEPIQKPTGKEQNKTSKLGIMATSLKSTVKKDFSSKTLHQIGQNLEKVANRYFTPTKKA